jgi:hypothetical protein
VKYFHPAYSYPVVFEMAQGIVYKWYLIEIAGIRLNMFRSPRVNTRRIVVQCIIWGAEHYTSETSYRFPSMSMVMAHTKLGHGCRSVGSEGKLTNS